MKRAEIVKAAAGTKSPLVSGWGAGEGGNVRGETKSQETKVRVSVRCP